MSQSKKSRVVELWLHVIIWLLLLALPFFYMEHADDGQLIIHWGRVAENTILMLFSMVVFYANYLYVIPRCLITHRQRRFYLINTALLLLLGAAIYFAVKYSYHSFSRGFHHRRFHPVISPDWLLFLRGELFLVVSVFAAVAVSTLKRMNDIERLVLETGRKQAESELKTLQNQLHPHFLLNTLNNIYSLITINAPQAQQSVLELSKMLRYMLYESEVASVPFQREADFLRNYIELMRIRLNTNVSVTTDIRVPGDSTTRVSPLLFIPLVENAFKHGVSPTEPCTISISLEDCTSEVRCTTRNSYFPKSASDKSGSGIGLEQVRRRLELIYPDRHTWTYGIEQTPQGEMFVSTLVVRVEV